DNEKLAIGPEVAPVMPLGSSRLEHQHMGLRNRHIEPFVVARHQSHRLIFQSVIDEFEDLILEFDDPTLSRPPIRAPVLRRVKCRDLDPDGLSRKLVAESPAHTSSLEDFYRN